MPTAVAVNVEHHTFRYPTFIPIIGRVCHDVNSAEPKTLFSRAVKVPEGWKAIRPYIKQQSALES